MLEGMLGADTMKKIIVNMMGLVFVILAFVGMIFVVYTSIVPPFHAYLWSALASVGCAGAWFVAKGKGSKLLLATVAFAAALWILLNSTYVWVIPTEGALPNMSLSATGALLIIFGSLAGITGSIK